jgi:hypothetical protein
VFLFAFKTAEQALAGETALRSKDTDGGLPTACVRSPCSAVFRHERYVANVWRDPSATGQCYEKLRAHVGRQFTEGLTPSTAGDGR